MLNKPLLLLLLISLGICGCIKSEFPTMDEVDSQITKYANEKDKNRKINLLKELLSKVSNPQNVSDDNIVRNTMEKLTEMYRENHDEAILIAVDETEIDGGFANFVCEFYRSLKSEKKFKERYRKTPKAIERCLGISFKEHEIKGL